VEDDRLVCAYHGWRFDPNGRCTSVPAHPGWAAPEGMRIGSFHVAVRYGLVWVCRGSPRRDVLPFPEYDDPNLRKVVCGPYDVEASGRASSRTSSTWAISRSCMRASWAIRADGGARLRGRPVGRRHRPKKPARDRLLLLAAPDEQPGHGGAEVEYSYRVVRPLTAILTKVPAAQAGFREAISLHVQPVEEEKSRAFIVLALTNFTQTEDELRAFQDRIFMQDAPILESQSRAGCPWPREPNAPCAATSCRWPTGATCTRHASNTGRLLKTRELTMNSARVD